MLSFNSLLRPIVGFMSLFILIPLMIVLWRAGTQHHYVWGLLDWSGPGPTGSYWKVAMAAAAGWVMLSALSIVPGRIPWLLSALWFGLFAIAVSLWSINSNQPLIVNGDAWGFSINMSVLMPSIMAAIALGSLCIAVLGLSTAPRNKDGWAPKKPIMLTVLLLIIPIAILFPIGEYNGFEDRIAIGFVVIQSIALYAMLMWPTYQTASKNFSLA